VVTAAVGEAAAVAEDLAEELELDGELTGVTLVVQPASTATAAKTRSRGFIPRDIAQRHPLPSSNPWSAGLRMSGR
jgi:hypothetical protein